MPLADLQQVQRLLDSMRAAPAPDRRLDAFRHLLAQLNYDAVQPSRQAVPFDRPADVPAAAVAEPPRLLARGAAGGDFHVLYTRLATPDLPRTVERPVVNRLLADHPYSLFVFSNADQSRWHFLNVKAARAEATDENRDPKVRRFFRRISVTPDDRLRTATERLYKLDLGDAADAPAPLAVQAKHDDAFDVEAVTGQFFKTYTDVFGEVETALARTLKNTATRRLFTQRLFNRLMFIAFIQKKGWLTPPGGIGGSAAYLDELWADYKRTPAVDRFYEDRLKPLFFRGLAEPRDRKDVALERIIGRTPYLNGGLFEPAEDQTDRMSSIGVPDRAIGAILHHLFAHYNFTVTESTPLDIEVAVDPEMLGKVFESLVTWRPDTGSYYTPKGIVSFMCREALKGYLRRRLADETADAIQRFVDDHDPAGLTNPEAVLDALRSVTVCDPACGSGAYLLGMLHELLDLRQALFALTQRDADKAYDRKQDIIRRNLYGADIDPFATNIAQLRLWLSLAVEYDGVEPKPLPSLDFKIGVGDSLAAPNPSESGQLQLHREAVEKFRVAKDVFADPYTPRHQKAEAGTEAKRLRDGIRAWLRGQGGGGNEFDWAVEFAEVFVRGGFDVVLANPPYGVDVATHYTKTVGHSDSYTSFVGLAVALGSPTSTCAYIMPTSWETGERFERFRRWFFGKNQVASVVNLPYDVFDVPFVDTGIVCFMPRRSTLDGQTVQVVTLPKRSQSGLDNIGSQLRPLPITAITNDRAWRLTLHADAVGLLTRLDGSAPLSSVCRIRRGIESYKYELRKSRGTDRNAMPFYQGQVYRYVAEPTTELAFVTVKQVDVPWHQGPRLLIRRLVSRDNRLMAARMDVEAVVKKDLYVLQVERDLGQQTLMFLLGLLNSSLLSYAYLTRSAAAQKDDFRQVSLDGLRGLPLPPDDSARATIAGLAMAASAAAGRPEFDSLSRRLDEIVFDAYGLAEPERNQVRDFLGQRG